jgi:uncharacterized membrane protein
MVASLAAALAMESGITGYYLFVYGTNSNLEMWSLADPQGGSVTPFMQEDVVFYANFTDSSTGAPISGGSVHCDIKFNISGSWTTPVTMSYNGTSDLYEHTGNFPGKGNYSWNVLCDGSSLGYDSDLNGTDYINIHRYDWWNNSWGYRIKLEIENGDYDVTNWPVERDINFTDVLRQLGDTGTFDGNSTRLLEYNQTGGVMHELPSHFDPDLYRYDAAGSAFGNAVFIMNGTTENNTRRTFYLYFDIEENGLKSEPSYSTNLTYVFIGDEIRVNNSRLDFRIDTNRSENTSGFHLVKFQDPSEPVPIFVSDNESERTIEYLEYSNGTYNFSFDLRENITVVEGPVRITVIQEGDEIIFGDLGSPTGEGTMVKKYYIYNSAGPEQLGSWVKIEQNFTNTAGYSIDRNSTGAGALAFDAARGWTPIGSSPGATPYDGNTTDPYSWYSIFSDGTEIVGVLNLNETSAGFFAVNRSIYGGRVGIELSDTSIASGQSVIETAAAYMGRGGTTEFINIKNALRHPYKITEEEYEPRTLLSYTDTEHDYYNRNESILLTVNITYDPYGPLSYVNITLNNATSSPADDINVTMHDDGTHGDQNASDNVYTNYYNTSISEYTGTWTATALLFDEDMILLNTSQKNFTLTKTLSVDTLIHNPNGDVGRVVNATVNVRNYRQDVWHPYAQVNCSVYQAAAKLFDVDQGNITDYENGSYAVNFTAPGWFGLFTLNCSAQHDGNDGYDTYDFSAEETQTDVQIVTDPTNYTAANVTWLDNESFMLRVNATNVANGTAYNASISIEIPANMTSNGTSLSCDDGEGGDTIPISKTCAIDFNITVLATTAPANFTVNATVDWDNKDTSHEQNQTSMNVTVNATYILDVLETNITAFVDSGVQTNIGNMTVRSFGNAPLTTVDFTATGFPAEFSFTYVPPDYAELPAGNTSLAKVYLDVASGYSTGFYTGTLNVTSANDGYEELELNVTVSGTNITLDIAPEQFTADNITYYDDQNFTLGFNTTNIGNVTGYGTNITLTFSDPLINTTNTTPYSCGDMSPGGNCSGAFEIVVSNGTPSGNYTLNVTVEWYNPEIGIWHNISTVNITVLSNVNLTIPQDWIAGSLVHNTSGVITNFTLNSTGNDPVLNVSIVIGDELGNFQNFNLQAVPNVTETQGGTVYAGQIIVVNVTGTIPLSYPNGTYLGYVNVTANNSGYKTINLNITVPETRTWTVGPQSCNHPESPEYGIACNITINNTGNVNISFDIIPAATSTDENNQTWPEVVSFQLENQTGTVIAVYYNITGDELDYYNASYNITAYLGEPGSMNISVLLTPLVKPIIEVFITPSQFPQLNSTEILVYVTDQADIVGINHTNVTVIRPKGMVDKLQMRRVGTSTNPYIYQDFYPDDPTDGLWGNTTERGNYTVSVYSEDNFGENDTVNSSFYAYSLMVIGLSTSRATGEYYQGETGTLLYSIKDAEGTPLAGTNVSINITDPTGRLVNMQNAEFTANQQGEPDIYPSFTLFSDSPTGGYNITAFSEYYEQALSLPLDNTSISPFSVIERRPGMMTMDLEAPAETSTTDGLEVVAIITDGVANIDPDTIVVSLYDPVDNLILENASMTKLSTGRYLRWYNTTASSNQGNWRWVVTITKESNVITKDVYTRLVGGPFDVRDISILDNSITVLGISVVIENTGDDSQDAFIQWNLTRSDTGASLKEGLDTVLIPANAEVTHEVNPSNITYLGDVRITFIVTYSGTEKAGAYEDFTTVEPAPPGPPGPGRGEEAPAAPVVPPGKPGIEITDYPDEIPTETGWAQYPSVTVNNTGQTTLHNVQIKLNGIPDSWYTVTPKLLPALNAGKTETFVINILVPSGTEAKQYYGTINATSDEAYDEKLTSVIVFGSREELVRYQLEKLKAAFEDFKEDVEAEEARGEKDLTRVKEIMDEIEYQIELTEGYLDAKMFEEALESVTTGWRLLDRARDLLRTAPQIKPVTILEIPDWMITLILILIILALALVILVNRYKKKINRIFKFRERAPESATAKDLIGIGPEAERAEEEAAAAARRADERKKIEKVLALLEREYKEGIISEKAYNELRKRNLEKFRELGGTV